MKFNNWHLQSFQPSVDPLPCPACGKIDKVWAGVDSAMSGGVGCSRCRLVVTRRFPERTPKGMPENLESKRPVNGRDEWTDWLYGYCTIQALKIWNRIKR